MANRRLSPDELTQLFEPLLGRTRDVLRERSHGDEALLWALRRKLWKELSYDERGKPAHRKKLKSRKWREQDGKCTLCDNLVAERYSELDRVDAMKGYTPENTRLLCHQCHIDDQRQKKYT